jgi:hypothetical protein
MRLSFYVKGSVMVAGLCLLGLVADAQQQTPPPSTGDPVADAARKAREDKKNAQKPKKVFTDDDVKPATPEPAPAGGFGGTAGTANPGQQADTGKEDPNGEKAWRKKFQDQRDKIAKAEKELDVLQREEDKSQVQYYSDPQKALKEQNTRSEINTIHAKVEAKKQEIAQLKQGLDDLETDLRKAGGDPGWAR